MRTITFGNTEFEGENNAYLLDEAGETGLIDTGVSTPTVREQLESGLDAYGIGFADIDAVLLTHFHSDHAGLAGAIQEASDATVYVHEADAPMVRQDPEAVDAMHERRVTKFTEWGMPEEKLEALLDYLESNDTRGTSPDVETVVDGDVITVGDLELEVLHAPGHAAGLSCFEFEADGAREAYVGDAVLPVYTPNVGGADTRVDNPLGKYLRTLRRIQSREYRRVWPGHRDVIEDPAGRCQSIIDHHRERTARVLGVLREHGPADPWTVSAHLFGELQGIHVMHGPGEAYAHLVHLADHGVVERVAEGYALVEDPGDDIEALI